MANVRDTGEELVAKIENAAGIILAVTENRNWIDLLFDNDTIFIKTVDLPVGIIVNIAKI